MFYLDGISAEEIGVIAEEEDFFSPASMDYDEIVIEGKNGSMFVEKGYRNVINAIKLYITDKNNIDYAKQMFNGKRTLRIGDKETIFRFYGDKKLARFGSIHTMNMNYIRAPFWYKAEDDYVLCTNKVTNEGNVESQPIIKLVGSGKVDVTVGTVRFVYDFGDETEVIIDCKEMTEMYDGLSKSKNMEIGFKYPVLVPGDNVVTVNGGDVEIYIKRKDAWL